MLRKWSSKVNNEYRGWHPGSVFFTSGEINTTGILPPPFPGRPQQELLSWPSSQVRTIRYFEPSFFSAGRIWLRNLLSQRSV
jgi:hypothetical protein